MAYDRLLAGRLRDMLAGVAGLEEAPMFGGVAFLLRRKVVAGVLGGEAMVRLGDEGAAAALAQPGVRPMDFTGRPLRGFVFLGGEALADESLRSAVGAAMAHVSGLAAAEAAGKPRRRRP